MKRWPLVLAVVVLAFAAMVATTAFVVYARTFELVAVTSDEPGLGAVIMRLRGRLLTKTVAHVRHTSFTTCELSWADMPSLWRDLHDVRDLGPVVVPTGWQEGPITRDDVQFTLREWRAERHGVTTPDTQPVSRLYERLAQPDCTTVELPTGL
jgi:hypothetical protein